jgi:hypothetical protein
MAHQGWTRLDDVFSETVFRFEGDASKYDCRMVSNVIRAAFAIIRGCFPSDSRIDFAFKHMADRFIKKAFITPEGVCIEITKGIPSGNV